MRIATSHCVYDDRSASTNIALMSDEKTEEPTEKKLEQAKKDGESPKSTDLPAALLFLAGAAVLDFAPGFQGDHLRQMFLIAFDVGHLSSQGYDIFDAMRVIGIQAAWVLLPMLALAFLVPIIGLVAQIGVNVTFKPLTPKFDAINPGAGLKRMFSLRSFIDLIKMTIKAVVLVAVLYKVTWLLMPAAAGLVYQSTFAAASIAWTLLCRFMAVGGFITLLLGVADYGIQRWLFIRDHRMTKDEIKRESKESEGDPEIKHKRKAFAKELLEEPPKAPLSQANALVVNPTHYAVAIRYAPEEHGLPRVIAKGLDDEALRMRAHAEAIGVPIVPAPPLARALYEVPLGDAVPDPLFDAVAEVLIWVSQLPQSGGSGLPA
ncbi:type III secretion system export apparatus subunit SctU [Pandoraea anhela]|uniref:EscU/YscU/HrcU family type III secretion system export apparatus switch protein n=1 Tax=Pandoraea anhela TaxID=2508295 RepID=A0A5E4RW95_9BURK|nr:type III secretion system export apparatus subunit SctU [Pandoraea anhela]VVD66118.1 EscU/YscU/HrcU family type III secretion system export apparatus switch protein [Pandoraea anhela]